MIEYFVILTLNSNGLLRSMNGTLAVPSTATPAEVFNQWMQSLSPEWRDTQVIFYLAQPNQAPVPSVHADIDREVTR